MGNKQSKFQKLPSFPKENWHQMPNPRAKTKPDHGICRLFRNNLTNQDVEEYLLSIHGRTELQQFLQFFEWREREDSIVNTKFFSQDQNNECCKEQYSAKVYIEHIPVRLSDIQDIPYPEYLYLLLSSLQGFEQLYQIVGYFRISQDLICMDKQGRVKVWLNSDLSKCYPSSTTFLDDTINRQKTEALEEQMVNEIMSVIEANTIDEDQMETNVFQYIRHGCKAWELTFRLAKQKLRNYAKQQKTEIPRFFESVIGIFDEPAHDNQEVFNQQKPRFESVVGPYNSNKIYPKYDNQISPTYVKSQRQLHVQSQEDIGDQEGGWVKIFDRVPLEDEFNFGSGVRSPVQKIANTEHFLHIPKAPSIIQELGQPNKVGSFNKSQMKVNFNYQGKASNFIPVYTTPMHNPIPIIAPVSSSIGKNLQFQQQSSPKHEGSGPSTTGRVMLNPNISSLKQNSKMTYSDSLSTYQLDPQIAEDIIKYLINQQ